MYHFRSAGTSWGSEADTATVLILCDGMNVCRSHRHILRLKDEIL